MAQPLEMYYSVDGKPGPQKHDRDVLEMGEYDIVIGKEFEFFIRNPNHNLVADISEFKTVKPNTFFYSSSDKIYPLQTVKCKIKIQGNEFLNEKIREVDLSKEEETLLFFKSVQAVNEDNKKQDKLDGRITWQEITVTMDDTTRTYGWGR